MGYTDKQVRNGATGDAGERSSQTGPVPNVSPVMGQAESAGNDRWNEGRGLLESPQGSGTGGHQVGSGGSMWEWDSGLAVDELSGEA
jgi:hypothetical protein